MMYSRSGVVLVLLIAQAVAERCTTPNNEQGECVSLYSCPILLNALATIQNASIEFVRKSNCGGSAVDPMVCCGSLSATAVRENKTSVHKGGNHKTNSLLPDRRYCGYQHADDYFHVDNSTGIDEFPWFAILLYESDGIIGPRCGGSLITNRYVLTAAHCVKRGRSSFEFVGVRLGEYNVNTQKDCIKNSQFDECSDPPEDFGVEKIIPYPMYSPVTWTDDIALLRLNRTVTYSDFIRPICLPTPGTKFSKIGDTLTATGWDLIDDDGESTGRKKKILTKLISNDECTAAYLQYKIVLTEDYFCTKELDTNREFPCQDDIGAPIMFSFRNQWHQEGISSFGGCQTRAPEIHTKVVNYLDWIQKNIEP